MFKEQKGITLIALVITIIVLLILAGVTIAMLTGENGILNRATKTEAVNAQAQATEQAKLAYMAVRTEIAAQMVEDGNYNPAGTKKTEQAKLTEVVEDDLMPSASAEEGWIDVDGATSGKITMTYRSPSLANDLKYTITLNDTSKTDTSGNKLTATASFDGPVETSKTANQGN